MSHYQHLSIKERESILKLSAEGKGIREISRVLGRNAGTISREVKWNSRKDGYQGNTLMNDHMNGEFPVLKPGVNAISWTGAVTKVVVRPNWRYL